MVFYVAISQRASPTKILYAFNVSPILATILLIPGDLYVNSEVPHYVISKIPISSFLDLRNFL